VSRALCELCTHSLRENEPRWPVHIPLLVDCYSTAVCTNTTTECPQQKWIEIRLQHGRMRCLERLPLAVTSIVSYYVSGTWCDAVLALHIVSVCCTEHMWFSDLPGTSQALTAQTPNALQAITSDHQVRHHLPAYRPGLKYFVTELVPKCSMLLHTSLIGGNVNDSSSARGCRSSNTAHIVITLPITDLVPGTQSKHVRHHKAGASTLWKDAPTGDEAIDEVRVCCDICLHLLHASSSR
jgi:hypothetical protein